jgi:DNA-binding MarR family transcriptional regulator
MFVEPEPPVREQRLVAYLAQWGPLTERQLCDDLLLDSEEVARIVARLSLAGRIASAGHDRYGDRCYVVP